MRRTRYSRKRQQIKLFNILASLLMLFSLFTPAMSVGASASNTGKHVSLNDVKPPKEKLSKRLLTEFSKSDEKVTFLVKFTEKADTKAAVKEAKEKAAKASLSNYQTELTQRSMVIAELKSTSLDSQQNVKEFLEEEINKGTVEEIESYYIVNGMAVTATKEIAEKIAKFPEVEKILPNEIRQLEKTTTNSSTDKTTQLSQDNNIEWNVERVGAPAAWAEGIDGTGTVVASIDSGVEWDHPALKEKYRGYDPETGEVNHDYSWYDAVDGRTTPYDDIGHGTHVTGTMVGGEPDGSNQVGVAPGAKWIAVKAFSADGGTDQDLFNAAQWILAPTDANGNERVDLAPDVVNNSWSGGYGLDEWYRDVVQHWRDAGIFPEFSAGNVTLTNPGGPGSVAHPANYPESFATGATDINDKVASFSLRGPSPYGEIKPDISAPGVNIRSAVPGGGYGNNNGTSMAGPAVSGAAALLRQIDNTIEVPAMEEILLTTARPLTDDQHPETPNNAYGYGLLDAYEAVMLLTEGRGMIEGNVFEGVEDNEPPTFKHTAPEEAYFGTDLPLSIEASDNFGIDSVELEYTINNSEVKNVTAERVSGTRENGTYRYAIPEEEIDAGTITYKWTVTDYAGHVVESPEYTVTLTDGITVGYFEDFENEPSGWQIVVREEGDKTTWEWGNPTSGPEKAYSGDNVYATNLDGEYDNWMMETLVMPPVNVPEEGQTFLQFAEWHEFEVAFGSPWDYGYVAVTQDLDKDQRDWDRLKQFTGTSEDWELHEIDLSEYSGEQIYVGFYAYSDAATTFDGWYIDDVALSSESIFDADGNVLKSEDVSVETKTTESTMEDEDNQVLVPLEAQVSVLETGRTVTSDSTTGEYSLNHVAGEFTLQAETYGYKPVQKVVTVEKDATVEADFVLEKLPRATINGTITNEQTGEPIAGATVFVMEDANVQPVKSDENGDFSVTAYTGDYTLKVVSNGYLPKNIKVELDKDQNLEIELEPFYTVPGEEIGYDSGYIDNARAFYDAGNGWGVRMSLAEGEENALVTEGVFRFYDEWPEENGTNFAVEVWDIGEDGLPSEKIAGPVEGEAIRELSKWTVVDLRDENIIVNGDFFMVYIQTENYPNTPGLVTDETDPPTGRSYEFVDGSWAQTPEDEGNFMIRARVDYEVRNPEITTPEEGFLTNDPEIIVEGVASENTSLKLLQNGEKVDAVEIGSEKSFEIPTTLTEGENEFVAVTLYEGKEVTRSEKVSVTLDTTAPEITITNPKDGSETNRETVTVEGRAVDEHLDYVEVNGREAALDGNKFSKRIIVDEGENEITVTAYDKAGNVSENTVTVFVDYEYEGPIETPKPEIGTVLPKDDLQVTGGDQVDISFVSDTEGGEAVYRIHFPAENTTQSVSGNSMTEVDPGVYEGTWTVPKNITLDGAVIEVAITNEHGNTSLSEAEGKLYISQKPQEPEEKIDRLSGKTRFDTAVEVSKEGWETADTVVLARSDEYADALAGVPLAHKLDAPILLTRPGELMASTFDEIKRLGAEKVVILGGTQAISSDIVAELEAEGIDVERISGKTRYDTAVEIAKKVAPEGANKVVVASGLDFPDALSVASQAAVNELPILLTRANTLPAQTEEALASLGVSETVVIGGTMAVNDAVMKQLPGAERVSGEKPHSDRYGTNIAIQNYFNVDSKHLYVATGQSYADALTGAVLAAKNNSSVLLVRSENLPEAITSYIESNDIKQLTLFGGAIAISEETEHALEELLK